MTKEQVELINSELARLHILLNNGASDGKLHSFALDKISDIHDRYFSIEFVTVADGEEDEEEEESDDE